jgi:hypothetical protein
MRDLAKQRELAKKAAVLLEQTQVLYRSPDGVFRFVSEGTEFNGEIIEYITQY